MSEPFPPMNSDDSGAQREGWELRDKFAGGLRMLASAYVLRPCEY